MSTGKPKIVVYFNSTLPHFSQLFAGLQFLAANNEIELTYELEADLYPINILKLQLSEKTIFFDLADSSKIDPDLYNQCDFYVKRMLLKADYQQMRKLIPYGLYCPVYFNNPYLKYLFFKDISYWKYSLKYWKVLSHLFNLKDSIDTNHLNLMCTKPADGRRVIFRSRIWDAGAHHPEWKSQKRKLLNEDRIKLNKMLAQELGPEFTGGIKRDPFSEKICPDLLLNKEDFHRKKYLMELGKSSIGIMTPGLEESIGAKFGEYIAFGLAVITSPIKKYQFLGPLEEGKHFLVYESPEECLDKTLYLFKNEGIRKKIQQSNIEYYKDWLHPGVKLKRIIENIETE